jgi:hypothetical protein
MKIKKIKEIGSRPVYDITVEGNHTYTLKNGVICHNTGIYYSADNIWIVGRQQDKEGTEIVGWNFIINIEKSRYVKEKTKIPISISYESGINKWSGFMDLALEGQYIAKPSNGWYQVVDRETGELVGQKYRKADIDNNSLFWNDIMEFVKKQFMFQGKILADEINELDEIQSIDEDEAE